jgi:putative acetyltransferase
MAADAPRLRIAEARWPRDRSLVEGLFRDYVASLDADISFQDVSSEFAGLPGKYARPSGVALIAWLGEEAAGAVAYRPVEPGVCEMKRLYVKPEFRGRGIARTLAERLIEEARAADYRTMVLDTLASMGAALTLYRSLGFVPIPAYYDNPLPGATYLALALRGT